MKQTEKFDLILRELYKYRNDGNYYSIYDICQEINVPFDSVMEIEKISHRLHDDGYVDAIFLVNGASAQLTSYGIDYCEGDSYTYKGQPLITNNIVNNIVNNGSNANIINNSTNITITQSSINEINQAIDKIRETVSTDISIDTEKVTEIVECLNEIQENIKNNQKSKFAIKSLIDITDSIPLSV